MKHLAIALAVATLALAASTTYLWHALQLERGRVGRALLPATVPPTSRETTPAAPGKAVNAMAFASSGTPSDRTGIPVDTPALDSPQIAARRQQLDRLNDPVARAARLAELREAFKPLLSAETTYAGLTPPESERLLDLSAESTVLWQQRRLECESTPGCDIRTVKATLRESASRDMEQAVGADKAQLLKTYDELRRVQTMGSQLPADQGLSDTTANALAAALTEERYRAAGDNESQAAFNQRMYDRAAGILTSEQLASFRKLQDAMFARDEE